MFYFKISLSCCLRSVFFLSFQNFIAALLCLVCSLLFHSGVAGWSFLGDTGVVYSRKATYLDLPCVQCGLR